MLAQLIGATTLLVVASLIIGQLALTITRPARGSWAAAPVGFSLLMLVLAPAAWLPGRTIVPLAGIAVLLIAGIVVLARRPGLLPPWITLPVLAPTVVLAAFPFIANARVGILGVNFNNDTAAHLLLVDAMHDGVVATTTPLLEHYPLGPHGVVAGLATLGFDSAIALSALAIALPILTALTALAFLRRAPWWIQAPTVALTALPYLAASYLAQGAFKESIMVFLLVGLAATLDEAAGSERDTRFLPAAVVMAGVVATYSYLGLAWPIGALGLVGAAWLATHLSSAERRRELGPALTGLVYPVILAGLTTVALLLPQFTRIQAFYDWNKAFGIKADDIGNLAGPISAKEALGVWFTGDFRLPPADTTISFLGAALVGVLLLAAAGWAVRKGRTTLVLFALACAVIAYVARGSQSPYSVAKAYVLISPFVFLIIGRAIGEDAWRARIPVRATALAVGAVAAGLGVWSTGLALRSAQVGNDRHARQLAQIRPVVQGKPTLYLGLDDFIQWELGGARVTQPLYGVEQFPFRAGKAWAYGQSFDVDTVPPKTLDTFEFVVTPKVTGDSELPDNFSRVATHGDYEVYHRDGPTRQRLILDEGQDGVATLNCSTADGRRISRMKGIAAIRGAQVRVPMAAIPPRSELAVALPLTAGTWDLSLRYSSTRPISVTGPGVDLDVPATQERAGSIWPIGAVSVARSESLPLVFKPDQTAFSVDASTQIATTELVAQLRTPQRIVPLAQACGKPVDWYRPGSSTAAATAQGGQR